MKKIKLSDINILDIGNKYSLAGSVWSGQGKFFLALLPDANIDGELEVLEMDVPDWQKFLRQSDILETEILKDDGSGIKKAIVRKSQRLIDSHIQWQVFKSDNYHCRYCGRDGINLTIDHIVTWEVGGPTIPVNLLTTCRKCNKERGQMEYEEWLNSDKYKRLSQKLPDEIRQENLDKLKDIPYIKTLLVNNIRSR